MPEHVVLPLAIRDVGPHPDAVRITGSRPDGLPDGVHTGGVWLFGGEIYKPLDGRPCANADCHYATDELALLEQFAGQPLFPRNWRVQEHGGRRFLVRPLCQVLPRDLPWSALTESDALQVEGAVRAVNQAGWEINDLLTLARDPAGQLFLLDLSAAAHVGVNATFGADELWRIQRFFEMAGFDRLLGLRRTAFSIVATCRFSLEHPGYRHVYICPDAAAAAEYWKAEKQTERLEDALRLSTGWLVSRARLDQGTCERLSLTWGWSPLCHKA